MWESEIDPNIFFNETNLLLSSWLVLFYKFKYFLPFGFPLFLISLLVWKVLLFFFRYKLSIRENWTSLSMLTSIRGHAMFIDQGGGQHSNNPWWVSFKILRQTQLHGLTMGWSHGAIFPKSNYRAYYMHYLGGLMGE